MIRIQLLIFISWWSCSLACAQIQSPEEWLERPPGTDFELADWNTIGGWFDHLGQQHPAVSTSQVGTSTEGRPFRLCVISSPENLQRLPSIQAMSQRIADPRGLSPQAAEALLDQAVPIVFVSCNMHSTEIAAAEMSMTLAWELATSEAQPWASVRDKVVTVIIPTVNPDGLDRVVNWYHKIVETPYEGASLPELYQWYAGHDNNRDWFALSLEETKIVTRLLYTQWFPTIYWDVHQQGSRRERMFVPPFRDPLNPNLHPITIAGIGALGSRAMLDLTSWGFTGISSGVTYDMWWSGGNRNVPVRHNIIGLLSEAASANLASPIWISPTSLSAPSGIETGYAPSNRFPAPWPGGWWRVGDIHRYEIALARSLLGSVAREPRSWLQNSLQVARDVIRRGRDEAPRGWLIPRQQRDPDALLRLLEILQAQGIEVMEATDEFQADGRPYPEGTLVLHREQPYGSFLKDLFEVQRYPDGPAPYDVAGWTLPLLFGIRRVEVLEKITVEATAVEDQQAVVARHSVAEADRLVQLVDKKFDKRVVVQQISATDTSRIPELFKAREAGARIYSQRDGSWGIERKDLEPTSSMPEFKARELPGSRIGVYAPWSASMDEGWLRWVLDHYQVPFQRIRNEQIRAGALSEIIDVLVIADIRQSTIEKGRASGSVFPELAGGLSPEGVIAIEEFVRGGGRLICTGKSSSFAINLFDLPLVSAQPEDSEEQFQCPGSIVRTVPVGDTPWTAGLPDSTAIFFSRSLAWRDEVREDEETSVKHLLQFPHQQILLSGWAKNEKVLAGATAWATSKVGKGRVHLFGFRPHYRSWSHGTFGPLLRAILLP
ncbi:MAG: peptidase M14 [Planctomycetes bacterium]|mgnify:FL=1|nr:peptidase M14 [Planctomycetota bacterium]